MDKDTFLVLEGIVIPMRSAVEFTEDWTSVGESEEHQTWDGESKIVAPLYKRKYRVTISAGGNAVWRMPALDAIEDGDEVVLHSMRWMTAAIPLGATQCILSRTPVAGTVRVVDPDTDATIPHTIVDRTVSIAAAATKPLAVLFRPKLTCLVVRAGDGNVDAAAGTGGWSMELVEKSAPA